MILGDDCLADSPLADADGGNLFPLGTVAEVEFTVEPTFAGTFSIESTFDWLMTTEPEL